MSSREPIPELGPVGIELVEQLSETRKYRHLPRSTLCDVVFHELGRHKRKPVIYSHCRRRLHKIQADYLHDLDFDQAEAALSRAFGTGRDEEIEAALRRILSSHASTRERLQKEEEFFRSIFRVTGPPRTVADLACGLTPLSFRWMGIRRDLEEYFAIDISTNFLGLVSHYFRLEQVPFTAFTCDILVDPITVQADVCFLAKMYHCLEARRRGAGWQAVERAPGRWVAITFPTRNLRGQRADIAGNYLGTLRHQAAARHWRLTEMESGEEQIVLVEKH